MVTGINERKKQIYHVLRFICYALLFSVSLQYTDVYDGFSSIIHYGKMFVLGAGFFLFYVSHRFCHLELCRKSILVLFCLVQLACMASAFLVSGIPILMMLYVLSLGYLGGVAYYDFSLFIKNAAFGGLLFGVTITVTSIFQSIWKLLEINARWMCVLSVILYCLLTIVYLFGNVCKIEQNDKKRGMGQKYLSRENLRMLLIVLCSYAILAACEVNWVYVQESGGVQMYTATRIFMGIGALCIGVIYDQKRDWLNLSFFAVLLLDFIAIYDSDYTTVRLSIFYFCAGAFNAYVNLVFLGVAAESRMPKLVASMGRILSVVEIVLYTFFGLTLRYRVFFTSIVILILLLFLVLVIFGNPLNDGMVKTEEKQEPDEGEVFRVFAENYHLTNREADVVRVLVSSEDSMKMLAEKLEISERMLYRHMNGIYKKTGCQSRAGIVKSFFDMKSKN